MPERDPGTRPRERLRPVLPKSDRALFALAFVAAGTSIAALLAHAAGIVRMPFTVSFVTLPGLVLLLSLMVWAGRAQKTLLFNRLWVGTVAGFLGLIGYDGIRWIIQMAFPSGFDAFSAIRGFGTFMTGKPPDHAAAIASGWAYHVTNGWTFGVVYAIVAGPARWWWGLIWGVTLEVAMILIYPALFRVRAYEAFLVVSIAGHVVYGSILGWWCRGHALSATDSGRSPATVA